MRKLLLGLLFSLSASAQSIYVVPQTTTSHPQLVFPGDYPTCTAFVSGQNDKVVTWTTTGGQIKGTNPSTANGPSTVALYSATNGGPYTMTATSHTGALTATCVIKFDSTALVSTPVTTQPRLGGWTAGNLAAMQAKAVSGNPMYQSGLLPVSAASFTTVNANWNFTCASGNGLPTSDYSASYPWNPVYYLAVEALLGDVSQNWGCAAQNVWAYNMHYWLDPTDNGTFSGGTQPGRYVNANYGFTGNDGADAAEQLSITPDLLLAAGYMGTGSGWTMSPGTVTNGAFTATATGGSATLTSVTVTSGTVAVGQTINCSSNIWPGEKILTYSGGSITIGDPATANTSITCTSGGMAAPTITSGGSGYLHNEILYWFMTQGTSTCIPTSYYRNNTSNQIANQGGYDVIAVGTATTNSSGVVTAVNVTSPPVGCGSTISSATFVPKNDQDTLRDYLQAMGSQTMNIPLTAGRAAAANGTDTFYNDPSQYIYQGTGSVFDYTGQRSMGNNYGHAKELFMTAVAFTFNDNTTDDPPLTNTCSATRYQTCADGSAGSLHAYGSFLMGGQYYKDWMHREDPAVGIAAYTAAFGNVAGKTTCGDSVATTNTTPFIFCYGDGSGGESSEGDWYQYSMYRSAVAEVNLLTAGYANPLLASSIATGPQASAIFSSWDDMKVDHDIRMLNYWTNIPFTQAFAYTFTGDTVYGFRSPGDFGWEGWKMVQDTLTGRTDRTSKLLWLQLYSSVGGISQFFANLRNAYGNENLIPLFQALPSGDPTSSPPSDPRPSLPTDTFSSNNNHIEVMTGTIPTNGPESPSDSGAAASTLQIFHAFGQLSRIDHEHETFGGFDVNSNGEVITARRQVGANYNMSLAMAENSNMMALGVAAVSPCTANPLGSCFEWNAATGGTDYNGTFPQIFAHGQTTSPGSTLYICTGTPCLATDVPGVAGNWSATTATPGGGQFWHGYQAGDGTMLHSEMPNYAAFSVIDPNDYNGSAAFSIGWGSLTGVTNASRSAYYSRTTLSSTHWMAYEDRGCSNYNTNDWITTTGAITLSGGNTAKWTTQSGTQDAYWTVVSPASGYTLSDAGGFDTSTNGAPQAEEWEPVAHVKEAWGSTACVQSVHLLQWGAHSYTKLTSTAVASTAGQTYDAALVGGTTLIGFMHAYPTAFTGTTLPASGATAVVINDTVPNTLYTLTGAGTPPSATSDNAGVLTFAATGTGSIAVSPSGGVVAPSSLTGTVKITGSATIQ